MRLIPVSAIPRQLAFEILDSIHTVLFVIGDTKSRSMLEAIVSKENLDPDCLEQDYLDLRHEDEDDTRYHYLGSRLMAIVDETKIRQPRRAICLCIESRSHGRYIMMIELVGIIFMVLFGIGAMLLGGFQILSARHL